MQNNSTFSLASHIFGPEGSKVSHLERGGREGRLVGGERGQMEGVVKGGGGQEG